MIKKSDTEKIAFTKSKRKKDTYRVLKKDVHRKYKEGQIKMKQHSFKGHVKRTLTEY